VSLMVGPPLLALNSDDFGADAALRTVERLCALGLFWYFV